MSKIAIAHLKSVSPYSQSKFHQAPMLSKETHADYEKRTWAERLHVDGSGHVFIPPGTFANNVKEAAKFLNMKIPGAGNNTYTKHFDAGVIVCKPLTLDVVKSDIKAEELFLNADGKRGGGSRVIRYYPRIDQWEGIVEYIICDDQITEKVFRKALDCGGSLIGIGRFRPKNRGYYGRFEVVSFKWSEQ